MRRTYALHCAIAAVAIIAAIALLPAGIAGAGGKGPGGGTCRKKCQTMATTTPESTTTTVEPTSTTTAPAPTTTTTTMPSWTPPPPPDDPADTVINDPSATGILDPLLRTRLIQHGPITGVLYIDSATFAPSVWFRDSSTQTTSIVDLPSDSRQGWTYAAAAMTSATDLWISGGNGPITIRHYSLAGSPLPGAATLVETRTFGTTDSRPGDMIALTSGGIVLAWHQQGATGPQGQQIVYRSATGTWSALPNLTFMPTGSSDQVIAQHPADGSVWLFSNPDMSHAVGVAHLTETAEGLNIDWVNASFIAEQAYGQYAPDPENPDLAVATDGATGTLALAYQSQDRQGEGVSPNIRVVSRPVVARIPAAGPISFMVAPVWAERVADIGLIVVGQETALTYREVDETGTLAGIHLVRHSGTGWSSPIPLANGSMTGVTYAAGRVEVVGMTDDVKIHVLAP